MMPHADVLEVIAEYACATVDGACALRAACEGYRRAVDTTVRRLVYEDQPQVRTSREVTLRIHRNTEDLDAVRIAFTCDAFKNIARLVVVAFALDGAKDELHEGGERRVACSDSVTDRPFATSDYRSSWATVAPTATSLNQSLMRCLTSLCVTEQLVSLNGHVLCETMEAGCWARVERLCCSTLGRFADSMGSFERILRAIGPQLTCLSLRLPPLLLCPVIAKCTKLTSVNVSDNGLASVASSSALCDALISSGAPLVEVDLRALLAADAVRLVEGVRSITRANMCQLRLAMLSDAAAQRLTHTYDRSRALPRAPLIELAEEDSSLWPASAYATDVVVVADFDGAPAAVDFGQLYPSMRRLTFDNCASYSSNDPFEELDLGFFSLPPSVTAVASRLLAHTGARIPQDLIGLVGRHGPLSLPNLATFMSHFDDDYDEFTHQGNAIPAVSVTPLLPFAATLTTLVLGGVRGADPLSDGSDALAELEAALAGLHALVHADIFALPTARCFIAGCHPRLRHLGVQCCDAPEVGAPFRELARACPRLISVTEHSFDSHPLDAPAGWLTSALGTIRRVSFGP